MRILHVLYESEGDYFGIGGVGKRAYEIYTRLRGRHDITLLCKRYPGARDRFIAGINHRFVGAESKSLAKTLLSFAYSASRYVRAHGHDFDLVIEDFSPAVPTFLFLYRKRPVVLQIQGYTGRRYFEKYPMWYAFPLYLFEKHLPHRYDHIMIVSEVTRQRFSLGTARDVRLIPNGISEELLHLQPGEANYILYLGRIDIHHKGLDVLLGAYPRFAAAFPEVRLVIAGDGRDRQRFEEAVSALPEGISRRIELRGWVSGEEKERTLRDALFLVFPSRYEVQPIAVLEAMACGKPVIVSNLPELSFATDTGAGISFVSEDADSLAEAMKSLAGSVSRTEMGLKGRESVRDCTWDRIARSCEEFFENVVQQSGASAKRRDH